MASSSSAKRAQAVKLCELCMEDNVKWMCIDCERCLCQKCKTIHLNIPVTAKHQIVTITTPIQDVQRKIITDNIPCKDHVTNMTVMFCNTCDCLVCPECVSTSHTKHQFIPIEKALGGKLKQLKCIKAKVSANIKLCDSKTREIDNLTPKYHSIVDESVTKIREKEQELKEAISKYSKLLQEKVKIERSKMNIIVTKVKQDVTEARKKLEDLQEELKTALASNQGQVIFETTLQQPVLNFDPPPQKVEHFIPETKTERKIQELFGLFETMTIPLVQQEMEFEVLRTFNTDLPVIHQVRPLNKTTAWISCETHHRSLKRKVTIQENNIISSNETSMNIYDMALTSDNAILLTIIGKSDVKRITESGEVKTFLTVAPLIPCGIHVTSDNEVIVGVIKQGATDTSTDLTDIMDQAIIVCDKGGKQKHNYQIDMDGKRLFTLPRRITTNNNQDILAIDRTSDTTGRVVTLDRIGNLRWVYKGNSKINATKRFYPRGITTTAAGYIIIGDCLTHSLHVLSENGDILTCKVMDDMGIMYPMGLNIDKGGFLWVGCDSLKESGAKLHIVKQLI